MKLKKLAAVAFGTMTDIIGPIFVLITSLFKRKQFCLWYRAQDMKWVKKGGPFSYRQCEKARATLVNDFHYAENAFSILRNGIAP